MQTDPFAPVKKLTEHGVPCVVIGGHAVNYHGHIRTTEDMDIIWLRNASTEGTMLRALQELNACWMSSEIDKETGLERLVPVTAPFIRTGNLMMLHTNEGYLDLFDYIPGFPEEPVEQLFGTAEELNGINFVSRDWLIKMKRKAGRRKDLEDIEAIS